jgi:hypothetical protein
MEQTKFILDKTFSIVASDLFMAWQVLKISDLSLSAPECLQVLTVIRDVSGRVTGSAREPNLFGETKTVICGLTSV